MRAQPSTRAPIAWLITADGVSRYGNALTNIAVPLIALSLTGSAMGVAAAGVAATLPLVLGGALGGIVIDRLGFWRASVVSDVLSGITILTLAVLLSFEGTPFWAVLALVAASNLLDAPGMAARQAQVPELTELAGTTLTRASSARATVQRAASMLGAATAGGLVALLSPSVALYINAVCFACAVLITLIGVPRLPRPVCAAERPGQSGTMGATPTSEQSSREPMSFSAVFAGLEFVWRTPLMRAVVLLVVITNLIDVAMFSVLAPLYARTVTPDGAVLGLIVAGFSVGALIGAGLYGIIGDRLPRRWLMLALFLLAGIPLMLVMAAGASMWIVTLTALGAGLAAGPVNPLVETALYRHVPHEIRGRVLAGLSTCVALGMPLGSLLAGIAADRIGLSASLLVAASMYAVAVLVLGRGKRWHGF